MLAKRERARDSAHLLPDLGGVARLREERGIELAARLGHVAGWSGRFSSSRLPILRLSFLRGSVVLRSAVLGFRDRFLGDIGHDGGLTRTRN